VFICVHPWLNLDYRNPRKFLIGNVNSSNYLFVWVPGPKMKHPFHYSLALMLGLSAALHVRAADETASFSTSGAQAIFDRNCIKCHGPLEHKTGLELDTMEAALRGNDEGPVIVPGKPEKSKLIAALSPDADPHMPPKKQLSPEDIATLRGWIAGLKSASPSKEVKPIGHVDARRIPKEPTAAIDYLLAAGWKSRGIRPAPLCDDPTFLRRVYLDLAGRIPTREEADAFLHDSKPKKRTRLVDQLLASDDYPRAFREIWDVLLMGRHTGRREQQRRDNGWNAFLEDAFRKDRPWNEVVSDIIVARPEKPENKGAAWFVYERRNQHQDIAEAIAPIIYGTRVSCAQCHDHPLAREIKQGHYWGLVTAFNRSKNVEGGTPAVSESAVGGYVNFTNLKKESQPAVMNLMTGRTIEETRPAEDVKEQDPPEGYVDSNARVKVPKISRRAELARAVTEGNPLLARSFVNYAWAILLGRGIVHPVDEMNSKHPASQPQLLDWLAQDFSAHNYDTRRLVRAIVLSRAYQLAVWKGPKAPAPETFAAAIEKPLTAETMARSARIASGRPPEDEALRKAFADAFPEVLPRVTRATIQQSMFLANNEVLAGLFNPDPGTAAERLARVPGVEDRAKDIFRAALIRQPDKNETAEAVKFLESHPDKPDQAAGQLLWALVAGPEFLTNH
jgi:mono/diheme cytochrome c family protein